MCIIVRLSLLNNKNYNILIKASYNKLRIHDYYGDEYLIIDEKINSNFSKNYNSRIIMSNTLKYLDKHENILLDLKKNDARTIMLIIDIYENMIFPSCNKYQICVNDYDLLKQLLPIDFFNKIDNRINNIKIKDSLLDIRIFISKNNGKYSLSCDFIIYDSNIYNIKIEHDCDHYIVNELLTSAINNSLKILDPLNRIISINHNDHYAFDIDYFYLKKDVICETLKYLTY